MVTFAIQDDDRGGEEDRFAFASTLLADGASPAVAAWAVNACPLAPTHLTCVPARSRLQRQSSPLTRPGVLVTGGRLCPCRLRHQVRLPSAKVQALQLLLACAALCEALPRLPRQPR